MNIEKAKSSNRKKCITDARKKGQENNKLDKALLKKHAIMKLKEFHRWQRISGNLSIDYDASFTLTVKGEHFPMLEELDFTIEKRALTATKEVEAIKWAVNQIPRSKQRQVLIMTYLEYGHNPEEMIEIIRYSQSGFYQLREKALIQFAFSYREGVLLTLK